MGQIKNIKLHIVTDIKILGIQNNNMNVAHEVTLLVEEMKRLGTENADGKISVTFGVLFSDDRCSNIFEALVGTLRAAKRKKVITFDGELLLQGVHDDVPIVLLKEAES